MHACLRDKLDQLRDGCRREELKLNIIQSRDIRLRPKLNKLCSEEIAVLCKDVQPGALPCKLYVYVSLFRTSVVTQGNHHQHEAAAFFSVAAYNLAQAAAGLQHFTEEPHITKPATRPGQPFGSSSTRTRS